MPAAAAFAVPPASPPRPIESPQAGASSRSAGPAPIADRGEFIDVLRQLDAGKLLVCSDVDPDRALIESGVVYHAHATLAAYGLLEEVPMRAVEREFAPHLHWYRLSPRGRDFAARACAEWKARPLWQRCWLRIVG